MDFKDLNVSLRTVKGKGPSRRMRQAGYAPAVVYGKGLDSISITLKPTELVKAVSGPWRTNTVLVLKFEDGKSIHALVRDHQYHPLTRELRHVDFLSVDVEKPIQVSVPFKTTGRSIGEQKGGLLSRVFRNLPVECLPGKVPVDITVDVTELSENASIDVSDLKLDEGVKVMLPDNTSVVTIISSKHQEEKTEDAAAEAGAEASAAAEGEKKE